MYVYLYIKMASTHNSIPRYIPIWYILYTHLQYKFSLHLKNKYIYTEKKKTTWINNFIDRKKTKHFKIQTWQSSNVKLISRCVALTGSRGLCTGGGEMHAGKPTTFSRRRFPPPPTRRLTDESDVTRSRPASWDLCSKIKYRHTASLRSAAGGRRGVTGPLRPSEGTTFRRTSTLWHLAAVSLRVKVTMKRWDRTSEQ